MPAFGEFFRHFIYKSRYVIGLAAGDQAAIGDNLFIHPFRTCV